MASLRRRRQPRRVRLPVHGSPQYRRQSFDPPGRGRLSVARSFDHKNTRRSREVSCLAGHWTNKRERRRQKMPIGKIERKTFCGNGYDSGYSRRYKSLDYSENCWWVASHFNDKSFAIVRLSYLVY